MDSEKKKLLCDVHLIYRGVWLAERREKQPSYVMELLDVLEQVRLLTGRLGKFGERPDPSVECRCGARGFGPSARGEGWCTFCDGTEGGRPPILYCRYCSSPTSGQEVGGVCSKCGKVYD